jgi:D-amino-acid oxidase
VEHQRLGDRDVIHNYGHGGAGLTLSWGCARNIVSLVDELDVARHGSPV